LSQQIIPYVFFDTTDIELTNYSQDDVVIKSDKVRIGFRGILRDVNTVFRNTGGTLAYEKVSSGGGVTRFAAAITATSNGSFDLVLSPGDSVQIVITTTGTGNIDVVWHGELIPVNVVKAFAKSSVQVDIPFEGGI